MNSLFVSLFLGLGFCCFVSSSQVLQNFVKVGCFKDNLQNRALPDLIINHRVKYPLIDWSNLSITIELCAKAAQNKGYVYFALQFWGECWAGKSAHLTYDKYGISTECERGVGKGSTNYVYRNTGVENECESPKVLDSPDRAITYHKTLSPHKCDNDITLPEDWYQFKGKAGNDIATTCSKKPSCGTLLAGWLDLKGSKPEPTQGITDGKVCFYWKEDCCKFSESIKIRNCGRFFVYKLKSPGIGCYSRYCGNGH